MPPTWLQTGYDTLARNWGRKIRSKHWCNHARRALKDITRPQMSTTVVGFLILFLSPSTGTIRTQAANSRIDWTNGYGVVAAQGTFEGGYNSLILVIFCWHTLWWLLPFWFCFRGALRTSRSHSFTLGTGTHLGHGHALGSLTRGQALLLLFGV